MKQTIYTFLLISVLGLASCRKDSNQLTIKQYDQQQITNYIASHGLTGMLRDTTGGDTSGIYYKILNPGTQSINGVPVKPLDYPDKITFVYTINAFDGSFVATDTIVNHFYDYVGHISADKLPLGLQTAIHNLLKYPDASMRVLIPSHLAYGINGTGSGSSQVANNRIKGNECLDYYIHAVNNFSVYDDLVIQNYLKANSLTGYTKVLSNMGTVNGRVDTGNYYYYKVLTAATTSDPITDNSTITATYTGQLLNATIFDGTHNGTNSATFAMTGFATPGNVEALEKFAVAGTKISVIIPSNLAYGVTAQTGIPAFSCMRFTWDVLTVTP